MAGRSPCLFAHADAIDPQTQLALTALAAFDVKRTGFSCSPIGIKRIAVGFLIISIARKLAARTHTDDPSCRLDAFAARRTVGVERAGHGLRVRKHANQSKKSKSRKKLSHASPARWRNGCENSIGSKLIRYGSKSQPASHRKLCQGIVIPPRPSPQLGSAVHRLPDYTVSVSTTQGRSRKEVPDRPKRR